MTPEQIAADLRVAAQRATPGPWSAKRHSADREPAHILTWPDTSKGGVHTRRLDSEFNGLFHKHDAEFIAAANPATILALLDHIAQLTTNVGRAKQARRHAVAVLTKEIVMARAIAIEDCAKAGEAEAASWVGRTRVVQAARQGALTAVATIRALALPAAPDTTT